MASIAVCILFYEKIEQTQECVASFLPSGVPVYILSNGSSEQSVTALRDAFLKYDQVRICHSEVNLGVAAGRNVLWRNAGEEWLFFVDNDITIQPGEWRPIAERYIAECGNGADAFAPELFNLPKGIVSPRLFYSQQENVLLPAPHGMPTVNLFPGGAVLVKRSVLEGLGGYDENFFVGLEDYELGIRAEKSGRPLRVLSVPEIRLVHEHVSAMTKLDGNAARQRYAPERIQFSVEYLYKKHGMLREESIDWAGEHHRFFVGSGEKEQEQLKPSPRFLSLYMTTKCNLACKGCKRDVIGSDSHADMSLEIVQNVLNRYPQIQSVSVCGFGEPTLNSALGDILRCLADAGVYRELVTNGTNPEKLRQLSALPQKTCISLYGYDRSSYISYTGRDCFDKALRSYSTLRELGGVVGFTWTLRKNDIDTFSRVLDLCDVLKPDFLRLHNYIAYNIANIQDRDTVACLSDDDVIKKVRELIGEREYVTPLRYLDVKNSKHTCQSYQTLMGVNGDGDIGGCLSQFSPSSSMGNIYRDHDPFNTRPMQRLRMREAYGCCPHPECLYCFRRTEHPDVYPPATASEIQMVEASGLFDEQWYRKTYLLGRPEIITPLEHFLQFGPKKGYRPNPDFDPRGYILLHPEVLQHGQNPFLHYIKNYKP